MINLEAQITIKEQKHLDTRPKILWAASLAWLRWKQTWKKKGLPTNEHTFVSGFMLGREMQDRLANDGKKKLIL